MYSDYGINGAVIGGVIFFYLVLFAGLYVYTALALGAIFRKTGVEPWKAWVPVYNSWTFLELGAFPGWIVLFVFIPYVGALGVAVIMYIAMWRIGVSFGKDAGLLILGIFLPLVWYGVVGWSSWQYTPQLSVNRGNRPPFIGHGSYPQSAPWPPYQAPPAGYAPPTAYQPPPAPGGYPALPPQVPGGYAAAPPPVAPPTPPAYQPPPAAPPVEPDQPPQP